MAAGREQRLLKVWALADERAGNRSQVLGVNQALGLPCEIKEIRYSRLARLPNALLGASLVGLTAESRAALSAPWPDIVIAAGRRAAPVLRAIKRQASGRTFVVQLMDPRGRRDDLDLIAVPVHDGVVEGSNIIRTVGAPHRVTPQQLAAARQDWLPRLAHLPSPRIALLVGGPTRRHGCTLEMARALGQKASQLAADANGSLLVSTSRRTGEAADDLLAAISVSHHAYQYGDSGENPYLGYLALADAVIVTGDSVSMCTEACATGAPVHIYAPPGFVTEKHRRLHQCLFDEGYARPLGPRLETWSYSAFNSAETVAGEIFKRLKMSVV
jgi:mitochondrial fission protein ELM1